MTLNVTLSAPPSLLVDNISIGWGHVRALQVSTSIRVIPLMLLFIPQSSSTADLEGRFFFLSPPFLSSSSESLEGEVGGSFPEDWSFSLAVCMLMIDGPVFVGAVGEGVGGRIGAGVFGALGDGVGIGVDVGVGCGV